VDVGAAPFVYGMLVVLEIPVVFACKNHRNGAALSGKMGKMGGGADALIDIVRTPPPIFLFCRLRYAPFRRRRQEAAESPSVERNYHVPFSMFASESSKNSEIFVCLPMPWRECRFFRFLHFCIFLRVICTFLLQICRLLLC
jgi:hypothetical protein